VKPKVIGPPVVKKPMDLAGFIRELERHCDPGRVDNAKKMLRADRFQLFVELDDEHLTGVVKSQSTDIRLYACQLKADGNYCCCTQNLNVCGGLRGALCKHLLVLLIGLTQSNQLDPAKASQWVKASRKQKPTLEKDSMTTTFVKYKGAEAGNIDWRPTITIPEDFYAI
jgi:hypothetical protein